MQNYNICSIINNERYIVEQMSYIIDVTYNVLKHGNLEQSGKEIHYIAQECCCESYYDDYEFERNVCIQRNHCVITVKFATSVCLIEFLKKIKRLKYLHVETIYRENMSMTMTNILYASTYYLTQLMDKHLAKKYKADKRERTYSEDEINILNALH